MDLVTFTHACVLSVVETQVEPVESGWIETSYVEVLADGSCPFVDLQLPDGVTIRELKARVRLSDGTKHKMNDARTRRLTRDVAGDGGLRFYTPEMIPGDRLELKLERHVAAGDYTWLVPAGTRFASLDTSVEVPTTPDGANRDGDQIWVSETQAALEVVLPHPSPSQGDVEDRVFAPVLEGAAASLAIELIVEDDPMRALYPGGGSTSRTTWDIRLPESDQDRGLVVPIPLDATEVRIDGTHIRRDDSVLLWADADKVPEHRVSYVTPDAPVYGERIALPGAEVTQTVSIEGGRIRWQDDRTWWLGAIGVKAIVPERTRLIQSLDSRFRRAAIPEPAMPAELRGRATDWQLLAELKSALAQRAGVADLPLAPLFPRRLVKARKSGAMTSVEAALVLWLQASQARVPAAWAVVRPADEGTGYHTSPAGYDVGLVAVKYGDTTQWIDPGCAVCAPFEIRPELEGADMLSPIGNRTPPPSEGSMRVEDTDGSRSVELTGPAALELRIWLAGLEKSSRSRQLAERFGGPDATLLESEGLARAGEAIRLVVEGASLPDPLAEPDREWWGWLGTRTWVHAAGEDARPRHEHQDGLCWTARSENNRVQEILTVASRRTTKDVARSLHESRLQPLPPVPTEPEPGVTEPSPEGDP